jgi:hypothetical protein
MTEQKIPTKILEDTATQVELPLSVVEAVAHHQWKTSNKALSSNKEVEVTGLCKFSLRKLAMKSKMRVLISYRDSHTKKLKIETDERTRKALELKLKTTVADIEYLKTKMTTDD